jgi:hypothetical protein
VAQSIEAGGLIVTIDEEEVDPVRVNPDGTIEIDQPDGGVVVQFNRGGPDAEAGTDIDPKEFYKNLVDDVEAGDLSIICEDLIEQIEADDKSRQDWLATRARGMDLLGLKLESPRSSVDSASGADGMSSVTNPMLLEMILKGWANAQSELLPARGPAKIEDVSGQETQKRDELAEELENGLNWYLTTKATEYYPDTSHMLLWGVYFGGSGFKKVHQDPLRKRPKSESVDAKDLIVSDTTKDLSACERITHVSLVRPSVMKRYQAKGYWRDVSLQPPTPQRDAVDEKVASIQGTMLDANRRPEDQPYTVWETQCELDLPRFAPKEFSSRGIPLPFRVTIEKDSRVVLALRRDWKPEDEDCERRKLYIKYPYVPGPGFYGTGMLGILGNASAALTAAWREALDTGMYANFPGGLVTQVGNRQQTSNLRPAPGEFVPVQVPSNTKIQDAFMPLPYKDITPGLMTLIDKIQAQAKAVGSAPDVPVGEGIQNIPVGTMLAHIEQATQIMAAAHKGMHQAQSEELDMIVDLFREEPEAFWRGNKKTKKGFWNEQKLFQALNTYSLVPRSDPNVPSHVHRMMKAVALVQMATLPIFAGRLDPDTILRRALAAMKEDPTGLVIQPPPSQGQPSPDAIKAAAALKSADAKMLGEENKAQQWQVDLAKEKIDSVQQIREGENKLAVQSIELERDKVKHSAEGQKAMVNAQAVAMKMQNDAAKGQFEVGKDQREWMKLGQAERKLQHDISVDRAGVASDFQKHAIDEQKTVLAANKQDAETSLKARAADQNDEKIKIAAKPKPAPKGKK